MCYAALTSVRVLGLCNSYGVLFSHHPVGAHHAVLCRTDVTAVFSSIPRIAVCFSCIHDKQQQQWQRSSCEWYGQPFDITCRITLNISKVQKCTKDSVQKTKDKVFKRQSVTKTKCDRQSVQKCTKDKVFKRQISFVRYINSASLCCPNYGINQWYK